MLSYFDWISCCSGGRMVDVIRNIKYQIHILEDKIVYNNKYWQWLCWPSNHVKMWLCWPSNVKYFFAFLGKMYNSAAKFKELKGGCSSCNGWYWYQWADEKSSTTLNQDLYRKLDECNKRNGCFPPFSCHLLHHLFD